MEELIRQGTQVSLIGAQDSDVETCVVVEDPVDLGEDVVELVDHEEEALVMVEDEDLPALIPWLVTGAGCVAIWAVIVLAPVHSC